MVKENNWLNKILAYGFYIWVFLLPWQTRYFLAKVNLNGAFWEYGSRVVYAGEILLVLLLILRLVIFFWQGEYHRWSFPRQWYFSLPLVLVAFVVYAILTASWSLLPGLSWYYGVKLLLALGVFWLASSKQIDFIRLVSMLVASGILQAVLAISQFVTQHVPANKWLGLAEQNPKVLGASVVENSESRWLRAYGAFSHPNILGGFLSVVLFFLTHLYLAAKQKLTGASRWQTNSYNAALLGAILIVTSGLLLSFSRAAWLATALLFVVWLVFSFFRKHRGDRPLLASLFFVIFLVSLLWVAVYSEPFITRLSGQETLELRSNQERLESLLGAGQLLKRKWLFGTGLGAYTFALYSQVDRYPAWFYQPVHNVYLLIIAEIGVGGWLLLAWLLYIILRRRRTREVYLLLFLMMFLWLFDHWWWSQQFGWYFTFLLLALIYKQLQIDEKKV